VDGVDSARGGGCCERGRCPHRPQRRHHPRQDPPLGSCTSSSKPTTSAEPIATPKQARHALRYVVNNWRRHGEDRDTRWPVDPYSSGIVFSGWAGREHAAGFRRPRGHEALVVAYPTVWLLTTGWKRHGLIRLNDRPGPRDPPRSNRAAAAPAID
jgi:hypothetical protein